MWCFWKAQGTFFFFFFFFTFTTIDIPSDSLQNSSIKFRLLEHFKVLISCYCLLSSLWILIELSTLFHLSQFQDINSQWKNISPGFVRLISNFGMNLSPSHAMFLPADPSPYLSLGAGYASFTFVSICLVSRFWNSSFTLVFPSSEDPLSWENLNLQSTFCREMKWMSDS